jgi:hypothetical protein
VVHVGPAGAGQTVKAANQLVVAGTIELLAEAIVFIEAHGVDTEAAPKVLGGGLAGSAVLERKGPAMLARDFTPGFRIELHDNDMGIVTTAAREAGVVIPLGAMVAQLIASLRAQGDGARPGSPCPGCRTCRRGGARPVRPPRPPARGRRRCGPRCPVRCEEDAELALPRHQLVRPLGEAQLVHGAHHGGGVPYVARVQRRDPRAALGLGLHQPLAGPPRTAKRPRCASRRCR